MDTLILLRWMSIDIQPTPSPPFAQIYVLQPLNSFTYDHRTLKTELPVRSAVLKQCTGGLVVRWVTTSESPLLYVFVFAQTGKAKEGYDMFL
jgi:hypothetical protein